MRIEIPRRVRRILQTLQEAGFAAYAVGGCVRDSVLGSEPNDWDICTSARPEQTAALFSHTVLTGAKYGTVTVVDGEICYEVTTFRAENGYDDHRHPKEIEFLSSLEDDLSRRDFSINAMAADLSGEVIDLFDGLHDLRHGLLRCVGEPSERFAEDALRILRALRFASRLEFTIEPKTAKAIHELCPTLQAVARERIAKELQLLCGGGVEAILREFPDVFAVLIPELRPCIGFRQFNFHHKYDVWEHTLCAVAAAPKDFCIRLALLLHDIGKPSCFTMDKNAVGHFYGHASVSGLLSEKILRRLRFDNATVKYVSQLVSLHDYPLAEMTERSVRRFLAKYGEKTLRDLMSVRYADAVATGMGEVRDLHERLEPLIEAVRKEEQPLQLKGADLLVLGVPQGKRISELLSLAQEAVFDEQIPNEHDALVAFVRNWIDKHSQTCYNKSKEGF
ncbi:MAG: HD domain-containing protein [Ruminococcaceae bacterium]|nr:HD domain-containing protein [Oscillospiraceae bacterium]